MTKPQDDIIDSLTPYQQARLRPGMWFGSESISSETLINFDDTKLIAETVSYTQAYSTYVREIIDNSLDEMIGKGFGNRLDINYDFKNQTFSIEDNGRGIPFDKIKTVFTSMFSGRNFRERGSVAGQNGVGAAITAFTSEYFIVTVKREGQSYTQKFHEDKWGMTNDFGPENILVEKPEIKNLTTKTTGTKIEFKASKNVYKTNALPLSFLKARAWEIAATNPKINVYFNGEHLKCSAKLERSFFNNLNTIVINIEEPESNFKSDFYLVPRFSNELGDELVHSLVNNIPAWDKAGKHISAFRSVFYNGFRNALKSESKRRKLEPNQSDISEGLLIFNVTRMDKPTFDSQSKTRLTNQEADRIVRKALDGDIAYRKIIREHPEWIEDIYARCAERTKKQDDADAAKLFKKQKRSKVEGLTDANGVDRSKCILYLGEGLSALGHLTTVRDPKIHGSLPLRGKPLNVDGKSLKQVLENEVLGSIINAIGLVPGQRANRHALRYNQVYIASDMDHDGYHITGLLIYFFNTFWPELLDPKSEKSFISVVLTPFIIASKGKERKYWYSEDLKTFDTSKYNKANGWEITRAKGLGTLMEKDWEYTLANPNLVPIVKDEKLNETLALIFGEGNEDKRKEWISI